jgi:cytochrome c553
VVAAVALAAVVLFVWIAPYNVAARIPHAPGVAWLLHTYMRNSVRTWSRGIEAPAWVDLQDPALVRLGAAHFEVGCAPCHGAPGRPPNPLTRGMRPAPPPLEVPTAEYEGRELYWIVRNGLKYTGMPAWSAVDREDEPWALAAFLHDFPELDAAAYAELAYGAADPGELGASLTITFGGLTDRLDDLVANCARCHGAEGLGRAGTAPKLAGQSRAFLEATLLAFAEGRRPSGVMGPIAAALAPAEMGRLATHYAELPPFGRGSREPTDPELARQGAELAAHGTSATPSCLSCHGGDLSPARNPLYPRIRGQNERFLLIWLELWRERPFGGTDYAHVMHEAATWLSDEDIRALAHFFASGRAHPGSE